VIYDLTHITLAHGAAGIMLFMIPDEQSSQNEWKGHYVNTYRVMDTIELPYVVLATLE
jgi:hypothetical protein